MAFVQNDVEFFTSTYPVITSGTQTKIIITSTPNGMNLFYKLYTDAVNGKNNFSPIKYTWEDHPLRDENWKKETIRNTSEKQFRQEHSCCIGNTIVTIKNKKTEFVEDLKIEELISRVEDSEILTPNGFQEFTGVFCKQVQETIMVRLSNGFEIEGSKDHLIETERGFVQLSELQKQDKVHTFDGLKSVSIIANKNQPCLVYDALNVSNGHRYFTNKIISHNCEFFGSSNTLLSGDCLERLNYKEPIFSDEFNFMYEKPKTDHVYVCLVDVGEGAGRDFSIINVIDITEKPYNQVFVYRRNDLSPWLFTPTVIEIANQYNQAHIQVENNSVGKIVADSIFYEHDYENIISSKNFKGEEKFAQFNSHGIGVRMDSKTKILGCSTLKTLLEENILVLNDWNTIQEMSWFTKSKSSYAALKGKTDDIAMTLVHFGWLTTQNFFENLSKPGMQDLMKEINQKREEEQMTAFGFFSDGTEIY